MDAEELLGRYEAGERDFQGVTLQYISLNAIEFIEADFTGAIFNHVSFKSILTNNSVVNCSFINCNLSCSQWWYCRIPMLVASYMQYAVMEGCYVRGDFINCDWRNSQVISCFFDGVVFDRCDLRNMRWSDGRRYVGSECEGLDPCGVLYTETFDREGVFHPRVYRGSRYEIPF